jgi:Ca-activated chloride channel homolog
MRVALVATIITGMAASPVSTTSAPAREYVLTGRVINDVGQPVNGATVFIAAPNASVGTDSDGFYLAKVNVEPRVDGKPPDIELRVRAFGYAPAMQVVRLDSDTVTTDFALKQEVNRLPTTVIGGDLPFTVTSVSVREMPLGHPGGVSAQPNTDEFSRIVENPFASPLVRPLSTFGADVDRASYGVVRRSIRDGKLPLADAVRVEELVNYFPYSYREPAGREKIAVHTAVAPAPWNPRHQIVRVALQTERLDVESLPPSNLVFLLDVSGSMDAPDRLPLVKQSMRLLVEQLREQDRVAIVVYAGAAGIVLPTTPGSRKGDILAALEGLRAGGSTAGGAGIQLAYRTAKESYLEGGNNRVILATDGDFNVGISSTSELTRFVEERRKEGIALTVLGFGMGNFKDGRLEQLADKGDGNYAYVDNILEARKVLVREMGATLVTVAKDVKIQVEFNPARVQAYRLIGYENRALRDEEFDDDKKDAGDMGAGHSVTALYEVVPAGVPLDVEIAEAPKRRYTEALRRVGGRDGEIATVRVRYQPPTGGVSQLIERRVVAGGAGADDDLRFAAAVAGYGMLLRDSPYKGRIDYRQIAELARGSIGADVDGFRRDFVAMVEETERLSLVAMR